MRQWLWVMCMKWVMWQVVAGSVHKMGGLVLQIGSVGAQRGGEDADLGPHRPNLLFQVVSAR